MIDGIIANVCYHLLYVQGWTYDELQSICNLTDEQIAKVKQLVEDK